MAELEFIKSLLIILGISAIVVFILDKLRVPSIIGFLLAGMFLGPHGLELIKNVHLVEIFAEIGVILLLFTIGLEFSLNKLFSIKKIVFISGPLQILFTTLMVFLISYFSGYEKNTALIFGFMISLSSTAIIMKILFDRAEIDSPHGRISVGVLIFQDLCVVLFILMIPLLSGKGRNISEVLLVMLKSFGIVLTVIIAARWFIPKLLHQIVRTKKRELFVISIIFLCFGAAFLTYELGLSIALGAFIAGLIISESEYSYQAISDILPFKESFIGLFFISIGMLLDLSVFISNISTILLVVLMIILIKTLATTSAIASTGRNLRISLHTALILSQIGEFSFILAVEALKSNILSNGMYQIFLSSAIISMLFTPLFVVLAPNISTWAASRSLIRRYHRMKAYSDSTVGKTGRIDHVIIIGYGINGRNLSIILKELEVSYVILEMNNETVLKMKREGEPIFYGDATSPEILHKVGIEKAKILVITIQDPVAGRKIVGIARKINPHIFIVIRTRYIVEIDELISIGADEVIPEEFETSIELFTRVLKYYQMPNILVNQYAEKFRNDHYSLFTKADQQRKIFQDTLALMPDINTDSFMVMEASSAENTSIELLQIHSKTGALVIAVKRGGEAISNPSPGFTFKKGDIVFLIGDKDSFKKAERLFVAKTDDNRSEYRKTS